MNTLSANPQSYGRRNWWTQEYRIVQTNLREIDALQDPREIARSLRKFGADVLVSNMGGIVAFYPTDLPFHHRNPYLRGDFVGEMIEAAHAEGLAYVGRFDLSKSMKLACDVHPDWFMRNRDGSFREYEGTYQACPNGGWAQEYGQEILREALTRYEPDGLFFNMGGYPITDYDNVSHGICVCDNCRREFRKMHGLELPQTEGFSDPNWIRYLDFQRRTAEELAAKLRGCIAKIRPGMPVTDFLSPDTVGRGEVQRRIYRAPPEWPYQAGEQSRWIQARNPGKPFSATSAAHIDYPWRQVTETAACHELRFAQMLATGSKLDLYLMGTLSDQDDPAYLEPLSQLYLWHDAHRHLYAGMQSAARIALYFSESTLFNGGGLKAPWVRYAHGAFRGAYGALVDSRLPFSLLSGDRLSSSRDPLADTYDVILLPHTMLLSDAECRALDGYVEAGGLLITTGMSGAYDEKGLLHETQRMACSPVESFGAPVVPRGWSLDAAAGQLDCGAARLAIDGHFFPVKARPGSENLVPFAPDQPFGPPELSYAPPDAPRRTEHALLAGRYGKGYSVHLPWLCDWQYHRDGLPAHQRLLAAIVSRYAPLPPVLVEGLGPVEVTVQQQADSGARLIHVINYAGQRNGRYDSPPALHGLRLGVLGPALSARALVGDVNIAPVRDERMPQYTWFSLPPVGSFQAIHIPGNSAGGAA